MERLTYILDTNAVSDYIKQFEPTAEHIREAIRSNYTIYLCQPVTYEVLRGLIAVKASRQRRIFEEDFAPLLMPLVVTETDWQQAAQFWANARNAGQQLSDVDALIAALAYRLNAVIVSDDGDFDALPVRRENWRQG